ncbi:MAG: hypothetical protein KGI82_07510 [Betaproteobacteria bacterium]|nr:hypothetical protein [Betaproteobacteria bacterium]
MTEYIVKIHFWLSCFDELTIEAASDTEAIELAKSAAASAMESHDSPDAIDYDERREGSVFYVDRVTLDEREEVSSFIGFDKDRLYPDWYELLVKLAALPTEIDSDEAKLNALRQYLELIEEAKAIHVQFA